MSAVLLSAASLAIGLVVALVLLIWWKQESLVFQPTGPPYPAALGSARVTYRASDGRELFGFVVGERRGAAQKIVIALHGNADLAAWQIPWAEQVARRTGALVLLPEMRGYGGIPGPPTTAGARLDASAALRFARDALGATPRRLVLFGHSLGSAMAAELAAEMPPAALVLQSPFSSARAMARIVVAQPVELVWGLISRVHYDTEARVRALGAPVWVAHGDRDVVIPVRMGRDVFVAARVKGELLIVAGAAHSDVPLVGGQTYWAWLARAIGD